MTNIIATKDSVQIVKPNGEEILATNVGATCIYYPASSEFQDDLHRGSTLSVFIKGSRTGLFGQHVTAKSPLEINGVEFTDAKSAYNALILALA